MARSLRVAGRSEGRADRSVFFAGSAASVRRFATPDLVAYVHTRPGWFRVSPGTPVPGHALYRPDIQ
ncbi:hypothetical protein [Actinopolymorpha pittospori]|uniref:Uncharacterized protein n=1 Tax=Actinopolymorpha pittospori TaxID=648752 RepID=A0A927N402_9ACTN|nr:hypothetical protein [Actinopolymorpha pittospori]MBE1610553.1 hypothetical protein [Actinopolymorpha pittospori]